MRRVSSSKTIFGETQLEFRGSEKTSMRFNKPTQLDAGIFLVSFAVLLLELLLTRIFSVTLFYHLSFMVVSLAMLGFAAGGLAANFWSNRFREPALLGQLSLLSLFFALTTVVAVFVALRVSVSLDPTRGNLVRLAFIYLVCVIPFFLSGLVIALLMSHRAERANRLYFFDLFGAALGCLAFIPLTNLLGAPNAVLIGAVAGAGAAIVFARDDSRPLFRASCLALALFLLAIAANARWDFLDVAAAKGRQQPPTLAAKWNSFSRVEVETLGQPADMWAPRPPHHAGLSATLDPDFRIPELYLRYDAGAATTILRFDGDLSRLWFLGYDVTSAPYQMRRYKNVLILGPGGGRDVLTALLLGSGPITGVEINPVTLELMRGKFRLFNGGLYNDYPGVNIVHDEGRSFLRHTSEQYDLIQASLVDTWAASTAGAYALTENNLYTVEAFAEHLKHLTPDGVIAFSRWFPSPPVEPLRVVTLAVEALRRQGVTDPAQHIFVVRTNADPRRVLSTILIKKSSFNAAELTGLRAWADRMDFVVSYSPDDRARGIAPNEFHELLSPGYERFVANYPFDISAVYDDRPFFFDRVPLAPWLAHRIGIAKSRLGEGNLTLGVETLLASLIISALCTVLLLLVPMIVSGYRRSELKTHHTRVGRARSLAWALYFSGLGLGFISVELVMIQRLNLFLGYPVYSLSVVLFTLLISSSVGSLASAKWNGILRLSAALAALCALLAVYSISLQPVLNAMLGARTPVRILTAAALLAPLGVLMGIPFPTGMRLASREARNLVSWAWAVNGGASVFGASLAMVISMTYGFSACSLVGFAAYSITLILIIVLKKLHARVPTAGVEWTRPQESHLPA
jgi:MFS family permease